ncbi:hypothetical protein L195_g064332, partial [Trifolium pratense]
MYFFAFSKNASNVFGSSIPTALAKSLSRCNPLSRRYNFMLSSTFTSTAALLNRS